MSPRQKKEFLKSLMIKKYEEMKNSEFKADKYYDTQLAELFSVAAGAMPNISVGVAWQMAREVINTKE